MRILYLTPVGKKKKMFDGEGVRLYDFDLIVNEVRDLISKKYENCDISIISELFHKNENISDKELSDFDVAICDLTTSNGNVTYFAGRIESLHVPIIYFHRAGEFPISHSIKRRLVYSEASLDNDFIDDLVKSIEIAIKNPLELLARSSNVQKKDKAFISYNHKDIEYLNRLMVHLRPLERRGLIDVWSDTKLKIGDKWQDEIEKALEESSIAILLISADFMASDFIISNELPALLAKAEVQGVRILPVILSPCRFLREPTLSRFQSAKLPSEPLCSLAHYDQENIYDKISCDIENALIN